MCYNIFSVGDGSKSGYELTRENFMEKTYKSFPFYQDSKRYRTPYFAICPACNNPIQINNLLGVQYEEENTGSQICEDIREITGVLLNNKKLNQLVDGYIAARDYCYTHTNKFNIPYSILYTRNAINIFGQKVDGTDIGQRIYNAIQNNCAYFEFLDERIQKNIDDYVELNLIVTNHRIRESRQYMTVRIEEKKREEIRTIFEEE